jgi:hypothetical protein
MYNRGAARPCHLACWLTQRNEAAAAENIHGRQDIIMVEAQMELHSGSSCAQIFVGDADHFDGHQLTLVGTCGAGRGVVETTVSSCWCAW